jgi:hypothetical protein
MHKPWFYPRLVLNAGMLQESSSSTHPPVRRRSRLLEEVSPTEPYPPGHHHGSSTENNAGRQLMPRSSISIGNLNRKRKEALLKEMPSPCLLPCHSTYHRHWTARKKRARVRQNRPRSSDDRLPNATGASSALLLHLLPSLRAPVHCLSTFPSASPPARASVRSGAAGATLNEAALESSRGWERRPSPWFELPLAVFLTRVLNYNTLLICTTTKACCACVLTTDAVCIRGYFH